LDCDRDALKQECRLARIACSGTQPPTHLREKTKEQGAIAPIIIIIIIWLLTAEGGYNLRQNTAKTA